MQVTNITASYTRKINHALYGGGNFESSDHFVSLSAEVEEGEDVTTSYKELNQACEEMITKAVEDEITSFAGGITADKFYTYIRDFVSGRPVDGETYHACNPRQQAILQAIKRGKQMHKRDTTKNEETIEG